MSVTPLDQNWKSHKTRGGGTHGFPSSQTIAKSAACVAGLSLFVIAAMACAAVASPAAMGGALLACTGVGLVYNLATAKNKSVVVIAILSAAICTTIGALTLTGGIPVKTTGWLLMGSTIVASYSACCGVSSFVAAEVLKG